MVFSGPRADFEGERRWAPKRILGWITAVTNLWTHFEVTPLPGEARARNIERVALAADVLAANAVKGDRRALNHVPSHLTVVLGVVMQPLRRKGSEGGVDRWRFVIQ